MNPQAGSYEGILFLSAPRPGFWVWLTSMLATGAVIGALAMAWIQGRGDAREFGQFPSIYCGTAGGQVVEQDNGSSYCAIWINRPDQ